MAESELWELSNEESFSKGASAGLGPPLLSQRRSRFCPQASGWDRSFLNCLSAWQANLAGTPAALP